MSQSATKPQQPSAIKTPPPGIHYDVPFDEYLAWPAVNNSSLTQAFRSMAHYRYHRDRRMEPTDAMRVGTFLHKGVLEPLGIAENYVVMPAFELEVRRENGEKYGNPRGTNAYRELVAEFEHVNRDKEVVTQELYDHLLGVVKAIHANQRARVYLSGCRTEVSVVWTDPPTGLICKARLDMLNDMTKRIADLKSDRDAAEFEWSIWKYHYDRQAAFYTDGHQIAAKANEPYQFCLVAAEKEPPYGVRAAPVGGRTISAGRAKYRQALGWIKAATRSGQWPGYDDPETWELPEAKMPSVQLTQGGKPI